ncbi:MAG: glycosyltransferase [Anaerolineales bacterium]|nr:glycosyltransferase [Anaerolineales bacterium]
MVILKKTSVDTRPRSELPEDLVLLGQHDLAGQIPSHPDLVVVIPAYDEARCIGSIVLQSRRFTSQVIVVDDGSTDDTAQIARSAGATLVCHERNQGKGAALS